MFQALIAIAVAFNLEASPFNTINAFINSDLDEEIYYQSLEGYQRSDSI
jgi:hypothetical protein